MLINKTVLVSGAEYFTDKDAINALMNASVPVNTAQAIEEHRAIVEAFKAVGIKVLRTDPPKDCQDGIYTANWALVRGNKAIMARLPNKRKPEEGYAKTVLSNLGLETIVLPENMRAFSGQGDSIVCDNMVFCQSPYRTSIEVHDFIKETLGFDQVFSLSTKPARWFKFGPTKNNKITGWPDSPTYDIDLAIAYLRPASANAKALIAYCPAVFKRQSRKLLKKLDLVDKITVSKKECLESFALNLVSTGESVVLNAGAPLFKNQLEQHGFKVIELKLPELKKGGGSIRCSSLTLD